MNRYQKRINKRTRCAMFGVETLSYRKVRILCRDNVKRIIKTFGKSCITRGLNKKA